MGLHFQPSVHFPLSRPDDKLNQHWQFWKYWESNPWQLGLEACMLTIVLCCLLPKKYFEHHSFSKSWKSQPELQTGFWVGTKRSRATQRMPSWNSASFHLDLPDSASQRWRTPCVSASVRQGVMHCPPPDGVSLPHNCPGWSPSGCNSREYRKKSFSGLQKIGSGLNPVMHPIPKKQLYF